MSGGELRIDVPWRDETLAGTLHRPTGAMNAIVVMLQGSGPSDRDGEGYFAPIRKVFLDRGIATYSFDKPGCGASTGDWRRYALLDRAEQATTVLDALAERLDVDGARFGIWGQSQGGWLVQIVAAERPQLAFAIANSGPSIDVVEQDLYGREHTMRANGDGDEAVSRAVEHVAAIHAAAARRATFDEVEASLIEPVRGEEWASYLDVADDLDWAHVVGLVTEAYEPVPTMERIRCPFLAVFGGMDVLVPGWRGARETGEALRACADATVAVFPHGDHRIQVGGPLDFAPGYLDLLGDWAAARVRRAG